jgi:hypothetical protein
MKRKNDFDLYLEEQLKHKGFAQRFKKAVEFWDAVIKESDAPKQRKFDKRPDRASRI